MTKLRFWCLIVIFISSVQINAFQVLNSTMIQRKSTRSTRDARLLIFNGGANVRLICGILCPTFIPKYQNINLLTNWSVGFSVPTVPRDWWLKIVGNVNFQQERSNLFEEADDTRRRFYEFFERQLISWGRNGRECLLRIICEIAEAPIRHNGLIGELLHVVFTPNDGEQVGEDYKAARRAGALGANCQNLFHDCPFGHNPLDRYSVLGLFTEPNFLSALNTM